MHRNAAAFLLNGNLLAQMVKNGFTTTLERHAGIAQTLVILTQNSDGMFALLFHILCARLFRVQFLEASLSGGSLLSDSREFR